MSRIPNIVAGFDALSTLPWSWRPRSDWFADRIGAAYVRFGRRSDRNPAHAGFYLTLATLQARSERSGFLAELLDAAEDFVSARPDVVGVLIESVNNECLLPFLNRRGYTIRPGHDPLGTGLGADWVKVMNPQIALT